MATPAPACKAALKQATERWPSRDRDWDGIMGDEAHQKRKSDHNSGDAFDLTHDPVSGCDCRVISKEIIRDPRVKYVIFNRRIWSRRFPAWRPYLGSSPHTAHMHVSIIAAMREIVDPWVGIGDAKPKPKPPTLRKGDTGAWVKTLQRKLGVTVDGSFGSKTEQAVKSFQRSKKLGIDGIVGPKTWKKLGY